MEFLPSPGILFTALMFVAMIGPLIFVHEYGHYLVARLFGTTIESFSIGFGRSVFGWTDKRGVRWKFGWMPLGGYVRFAGDANAAGMPSDLSGIPMSERSRMFAFKPLWQRTLIVAAGPAINFLAAILIFSAYIAVEGQNFTPPVVTSVVDGSPAAEAGVRAGDRITTVDDKPVERFEDIIGSVMINPGTSVRLTFERGGERLSAVLTPDRIEERDRFGNVFTLPRIGIVGNSRERIERGPVEAVYYGTRQVVETTDMMVKGLVQVITGRRSVKELGGPLKIAEVSGQAGSIGIDAFVNLMALVSINLGFINLLPIPMLDGGHLAMYVAEGVRRRPLSPRIQEWAFMTGFALLISFMLLVTWNDLASFGVFKHVARIIG